MSSFILIVVLVIHCLIDESEYGFDICFFVPIIQKYDVNTIYIIKLYVTNVSIPFFHFYNTESSINLAFFILFGVLNVLVHKKI